MKIKKVLNNAYSAAKARKEILMGRLNPIHNREAKKEKRQIKNEGPFVCKCGRSIYDHPCLTVGPHYTSMPYHGDLCPFLMIKEWHDCHWIHLLQMRESGWRREAKRRPLSFLHRGPMEATTIAFVHYDKERYCSRCMEKRPISLIFCGECGNRLRYKAKMKHTSARAKRLMRNKLCREKTETGIKWNDFSCSPFVPDSLLL